MLPHFSPTELSALDVSAKVKEKASKVKTLTGVVMAGYARSLGISLQQQGGTHTC